MLLYDLDRVDGLDVDPRFVGTVTAVDIEYPVDMDHRTFLNSEPKEWIDSSDDGESLTGASRSSRQTDSNVISDTLREVCQVTLTLFKCLMLLMFNVFNFYRCYSATALCE
jgi:hypothetical protein